ncbi:neutral cholesterol ester hydrolase 1-like [Patiria miniata]|uniref:Alpha/beta hydrolase fold-3 domain-containing protein n=1 Tax=Patiria miniata TaxID=46514 RepID=A0A914B410_PATMI|nr:neutral cholesterol ester hydrolase 1-like [Patiria miniata]
MARLIIVAVIVVVVAVAAYVVLEPVPDDVGDRPWAVKMSSLRSNLKPYLKWWTPTGLNQWLEEKSAGVSRATEPQVPYRHAVFDRVPVRIFDDGPAGGRTDKRQAIVYYHGGGFISGNLDTHHPITALLARRLNAVVVSIDYLLSPKYPFPAAIDDCTAATVWFLKHLSEYNVDPARVALMGDSAGGNLAAAVSQRFTFDPKYLVLPKIKLQILLYPCLQAFDFQTPSYQQNGDYKTLLLDRPLMTFMWDSYLRGNKASYCEAMRTNSHTSAAAKRSQLVQKCLSHDLIPDEFKQKGYEAPSTDFGDESIYNEIKEVLLNPDYAPLMREDLRGLPEAYILTAQYDILRDDGIMYAKRLEEAGVPVTWKHYKTGFHAMFTGKQDLPVVTTPTGIQSVSDLLHFARANL